MTGLIDAAFSRVRVVLTAMVVCILFGYLSYQNIPREADPDVSIPIVLVSIPLPGVSPEDGERLLVRPTELELQSIEGLLQMDSIAYDGVAQIILEFQTALDIDQAVLDVREAVDRAKSEYPTTAEEPIVQEFNAQTQFPILTTIIHGNAPERTMLRVAQQLEDRLNSVNGVLEATLSGDREELLEVIVDPELIESLGLTELEVVNAVTSNNQLVTAGSLNISDGQFQTKLPGLVRNAPDLMAIPIRANGENTLTIGDVGEVRRTFKDRSSFALFNGRPAIAVDISKRSGANIVEIINATKAAVEEEAKFWPESLKYEFIGDQSIFVRDALEGLTASVMTAILLVMIVIVGALGMRSAIMVGVAIPTTFLIGFLLLTVSGLTLNMMVMFGLVLSVGMLVDGAIVIIEFADRRMAEGADRRTAYSEASKRMFWPVATSTATTLAAFIPFLFWQGTVGDFMKFLPLTMIFILTSSLVVALFFLPVLGSVLGVPESWKRKFNIKGKTDGPKDLEIDEVDPTTLKGPIGGYARILSRMLTAPLRMIGASIVLVLVCYCSFLVAAPETEFFIRSDNEQVNILVLARGNLSAEQQLAITEEVASRVVDHPAIEHIYLRSGTGLFQGNNAPPETIGLVGIDLISYSQRKHSQEILNEFRKLTANVPGVIVEVRQQEAGPPVDKDAIVELSSPSFDAMVLAAQKVRAFLDEAETTVNGRTVPVYMDQEDTLPLPGIEWSMDVDRTLAGQYGLTVQQAGAVLQLVTDGLLVDRYRPDDADEEVDIRVRFPEESRSILALDHVRVQTSNGSVPLSNFVTRQAKPQVDRITRRDGRRIIELKANGSSLVPGHEVSQDLAISTVKSWLESGALGEDVTWIMRGADEETANAMAFLGLAMGAAMFMIALILLLEFDSFYHAALTLSAVILSVFGVLLGISISGQYISVIMTGVGIVALAGIVVNNNIVLIDTYQHQRKKGLPVEEAVVRTTAQRIRPVLLTTVTTILGLLPMVFEWNVDFGRGVISIGSTTSDWWVLLSSAVVYGLAFSTFLTLILTPVLLAAPTVIARNFSRNKQDEQQGTEHSPAIKSSTNQHHAAE